MDPVIWRRVRHNTNAVEQKHQQTYSYGKDQPLTEAVRL